MSTAVARAISLLQHKGRAMFINQGWCSSVLLALVMI
jgi:hypothetical protein